MDRYTNVLNYVTRTPWAIRSEMAVVIMGILRERCAGVRLTAEEIDARLAEASAVRAARPGAGAQATTAVAVIPVLGVIESRMEAMSALSGATSPQSIARAFRTALADPAVTAIVLDVDSPGGTVSGLVELADEIYKARGGKKPIVAVANSMAASAAYWIASQADEFVVTPSGEVGSIGVLTMHADLSKALEDEGVKVTFIHAGKHKVEGNPYEALGAEARAAIQADIDAYYRMFTSAVARGRRVSVDMVRSEAFGEGRMVLAKEAAARGMVDRVETFDSVIARLAKPRATAGQAAGQATGERLGAEVGVAAGQPGALALDASTGMDEDNWVEGAAIDTPREAVDGDTVTGDGSGPPLQPITGHGPDARRDYYQTAAAIAAAEA